MVVFNLLRHLSLYTIVSLEQSITEPIHDSWKYIDRTLGHFKVKIIYVKLWNRMNDFMDS